MTTRYLIIENGDLVDGAMLDRDGVIKTLPYCKSGAKVLAFDLERALIGLTSIYDDTALFIRSTHAKQAWTRDDIAGSVLADYITLPLSREEQRADDADARRHEL